MDFNINVLSDNPAEMTEFAIAFSTGLWYTVSNGQCKTVLYFEGT